MDFRKDFNEIMEWVFSGWTIICGIFLIIASVYPFSPMALMFGLGNMYCGLHMLEKLNRKDNEKHELF